MGTCMCLWGHGCVCGDAGDLSEAVSPDVINRLLVDHVSPLGPFLLQVVLPLGTGDRQRGLPASGPALRPSPSPGPPLTLCRANLVSKTPFFTKSSNVSGGHRECRVRGVRGDPALLSPHRHPSWDGGGALHRPPAHPILTTSCCLAVQYKVDNSDSGTQELLRGPHPLSGRVPGPSVSLVEPPACLP